MCIFGNIMKEEIKKEKEESPEEFIETEDALKMEDTDSGLFALGLLSKNLQDIGIETCIKKTGNENESDSNISYNDSNNEDNEENKDKTEDKEEEDAATTCLQFITNGFAQKKKYDLHFDFGNERNEELLNDKEEFEKFKENLKLKLSKDYNIPADKIIVTFPQRGSVHVQIIFQSEEFNNLEINEFIENFKNDKEFDELKYLKEIHSDVLLGACKLSKAQLDSRGNRSEGWGEGEKRGKLPYDPPLGWVGIGLKVLDKFEDNIWIGMDNVDGEWCVAYHGVGRNEKESNKVKNIIGNICVGGFKKGQNQNHADCEDENHPGNLVGKGVYCTPLISIAEEYSGESDINGEKYKTVIMVRVNPEKIRKCNCKIGKDYWVVNGTADEIRPYRILYKKV